MDKTVIEEGDDDGGGGGGFIIVDPDFGLNSEQETDSSDEEGDFLDSDDDTPLADLIPLAGIAQSVPQTKEGNKKHAYRWRADRVPPASARADITFKGDALKGWDCLENPIDYFKAFFDNGMIQSIADNTNLYATQCDLRKGSVGTSKVEIEKLLSVYLKMCITSMPRYSMYWESATRYEPVASLLSRDRFKQLKKFLHFNDNSKAPGRKDKDYDKLYKIRPLLRMLRDNCSKVTPEEHNSVDEQIIPFKGKSSLRRYMPKKPKKWGFKVFSRNGQSGFCYDFEVEGAPDPEQPSIESIGYSSGDIVLRMCNNLPRNKNYKVIFDNYFTFPELLSKLKKWGMCAVGTIRQDRLRGCDEVLLPENELKKKGRGAFCGAVDLNTGVTVVRWYDRKLVQLASNFLFTHPTDIVQRWSRKENAHVEVPRPQIVIVYNEGMGGVDLFDMFQALYRLHHKSRKGYMRFFFWALATAVINGWCLYRRVASSCSTVIGRQLDLLEFTSAVSSSLAEGVVEKRRRGRPSLEGREEEDQPKMPRKAPDNRPPQPDVRTDGMGHWPIYRGDRPRCFHCGAKTRLGCIKCGKGLCLTDSRNCFVDFHKK